jgi:DNA-binding MarR family transcriptional regulator
MMNTAARITAQSMLPPPPAPGESRIYDRYGDVSVAGFQPLPDVLLFHQAELGLKSEDLNVLLNILAHWYHPGSMPYLRTSTIAKRMGVSQRSVQRSIVRLREQGFIGRGEDTREGERFDVNPLLERLLPYARKKLAIRRAMKEGPFGMA